MMKRIILTILSLAIGFCTCFSHLAVSADSVEDGTAKSSLSMAQTDDREFVRVKGRGYYNDTSLRLTWSASGYSVRFYGTELTATMSAEGTSGVMNIYTDKNSNQYYFDTEPVNYSKPRAQYNALCPHITLANGQKTYTVVSGLEEGFHTVTLLKRGELVRSSNISLSALSTDGYFCDPPAESPRKIEIVGDSNATGFGNLASGGGDYVWSEQDATLSFGAYCAEALSADYSLCARSGSTVTPGYAEGSMLDTYIMKDRWNGVTDEYDFGSGSDVVIVHLGDNDRDGGAGWKNYVTYMAKFLNQIREKNPEATIICVFSLCGGYTNWYQYVQQAIDAAAEEYGVTDVYPYLNYDTSNGAPGGHALQKYHKILGLNLAEYIRTLKGWEGNVYEAVTDPSDANITIQLENSYYKPGDTVNASVSVSTGFIDTVTVQKIGTEYGEIVEANVSNGIVSFVMPEDRVLISATATNKAMYGDIDYDRKADASDALLALKYAVQTVSLTETQIQAADVDVDGNVTAADALLILKYAVGKIETFPAGDLFEI